MSGTYIWLQTLGGVRGDQIDPAAVPADRIADAQELIMAAMAVGEGASVAIPDWPGATLQAISVKTALLATIAIGGMPVVTLGVARRDRDGAKLWPRLVALAEKVGLDPTPIRPREPWAVAVPYAALFCHVDAIDWLPLIEAEIACAWIELAIRRD